MSGRSRLWRRVSTAGELAYAYVLPYNATLLQLIITWSATTSFFEMTDIVKASGVAAVYDATIKEVCHDTENITELICEPMTEFRRGDSFEATYLNSDGITVSVEACFREGD